MDPADFVDAVRDDKQTALSRLGSSKSLYAATGGEMDAGPVLRATAEGERTARDTFGEWAETDADEDVRAFFEAIAEEEDEHYRTVLDELDDEPGKSTDVSELHRYLRGLDESLPRLGAFVGRTLASDASKGQVVGFFTGNADPRTASTFRTLREDLDGQLDRALSLLSDRCATEDDWDVAREHAEEAIQTAYEEHVAALESLGVDPKPVC